MRMTFELSTIKHDFMPPFAFFGMQTKPAHGTGPVDFELLDFAENREPRNIENDSNYYPTDRSRC